VSPKALVAVCSAALVAIAGLGLFFLMRHSEREARLDRRISVFFRQGASPAAMKAVGDRLAGIGNASVRFVSQREALNEIHRHYPELSAGMFNSALPAAFRARTTSPDACRALRSVLRPRPRSVENVTVVVLPLPSR